MALSLNGCGTGYKGMGEFAPDGSFITTLWSMFFYLPLVPRASMRARLLEGSGAFYKEYEVIKELPVHWPQALKTYAYFYVLFPLFFFTARKLHFSDTTIIIGIILLVFIPKAREYLKQRAMG